MAYNNQAVDMRHGQKTQGLFGIVGLVPYVVDDGVAVWFFERPDLH